MSLRRLRANTDVPCQRGYTTVQAKGGLFVVCDRALHAMINLLTSLKQLIVIWDTIPRKLWQVRKLAEPIFPCVVMLIVKWPNQGGAFNHEKALGEIDSCVEVRPKTAELDKGNNPLLIFTDRDIPKVLIISISEHRQNCLSNSFTYVN